MVQLKLCSGHNTILYMSLQRFGQQMSWSTWLHISTIMQRGLHGLMLQLCLDRTHIIIGTLFKPSSNIFFSCIFIIVFNLCLYDFLVPLNITFFLLASHQCWHKSLKCRWYGTLSRASLIGRLNLFVWEIAPMNYANPWFWIVIEWKFQGNLNKPRQIKLTCLLCSCAPSVWLEWYETQRVDSNGNNHRQLN